MSDREFAGPIPEVYDRCLGPLLFRPFAVDLARRLAALSVSRALELAAGTGIATREAVRVLPPATHLVATDLNQAMLDTAARRAPTVVFRPADAQDLPFPDDDFDALFCQFGVMFLPDKARAYGEMRRVVRDGGTVLFTVWDSIEASPLAAQVTASLARCFPADPPRFLSRVPHGYHDAAAIETAVRAAGFGSVTVEGVTLPAVAPSAREVAEGFCQGTPLRHQITSRDPAGLQRVTGVVEADVRERFGVGEVRADMRALVVTAR